MNHKTPYCTCSKNRQDGWSQAGNQIWTHPRCGKVSMLAHTKVVLDTLYNELLMIIERISTKQENEDGMDKGRAEAICYAIAVVEDPAKPNAVEIKTKAVAQYRKSLQES